MDLNTIVGFLNNIPGVGQYVTLVVSIAIVLPGIVTALVTIWHCVVQIMLLVAKLPKCDGMAPIANKMLADSQVVDADSNKAIQVLSKLSSLPLPQGGNVQK